MQTVTLTAARSAASFALMLILALPCSPAERAQPQIETEWLPHGAWVDASQLAGVPLEIFYGIALAESGMDLAAGRVPWPWTLNVNRPRASFRFANRVAAERALRALLAAGYYNIDIGPMQINCKANCWRVPSPLDLLDPRINVYTSAKILSEQLATFGGDLALAVGSYNTGTRGVSSEASSVYQDRVANQVRRLRRQDRAHP